MGKIMKQASRPLLATEESLSNVGPSKFVALYDTAVMLEMKPSLAQGYLTLLQGNCEQPKQSKSKKKSKAAREDALTLAFGALTDGNVIDAVFGMNSIAAKENAYASALIKQAKEALDDADLRNDNVREVAVEAYKNGFQTILEMNKSLDKLNFLTVCFLEKKIRNRAISQLAFVFQPLEQLISAP
jgi:hypothetical protein